MQSTRTVGLRYILLRFMDVLAAFSCCCAGVHMRLMLTTLDALQVCCILYAHIHVCTEVYFSSGISSVKYDHAWTMSVWLGFASLPFSHQ